MYGGGPSLCTSYSLESLPQAYVLVDICRAIVAHRRLKRLPFGMRTMTVMLSGSVAAGSAGSAASFSASVERSSAAARSASVSAARRSASACSAASWASRALRSAASCFRRSACAISGGSVMHLDTDIMPPSFVRGHEHKSCAQVRLDCSIDVTFHAPRDSATC